jgi:hypothetical protein
MALKRPSPRGCILLRLTGWLAGLLLVLGTAAFVFGYRLLLRMYQPAIEEVSKDLQEQAGFFCEQQALLARDPWFHEPRSEGDAGELLNAWVSWDRRSPPEGSPLAIPAHLPQDSRNFEHWLTLEADVSTLDFGWMRRLHAYDRWSIPRGSPGQPEDGLDWLRSFFTSPLQLWAKFRLLQGLRTGQPVEAAREVRHLAWLAYRTDTVLGGALASALLRFEREAHDSLEAPPPEWRPMSLEQLARLKAILGTGYLFSSLLAPPQAASHTRRCGLPAVSGCAALAEAAQVMKYVKPLAEARYARSYAVLAEDLEALSCPTSRARDSWERGRSYAPGRRQESNGSTWLELLPEQRALVTHIEPPRWFPRLPAPFLRSVILGELLVHNVPGDLRLLEDFRARLQSGDFPPESPPRPETP